MGLASTEPQSPLFVKIPDIAHSMPDAVFFITDLRMSRFLRLFFIFGGGSSLRGGFFAWA